MYINKYDIIIDKEIGAVRKRCGSEKAEKGGNLYP